MASTARSTGLGALALNYVPGPARTDQLAAQSSSWVVVGRPRDAARFAAKGWSEPLPGPILTDDFSDILPLLRFP